MNNPDQSFLELPDTKPVEVITEGEESRLIDHNNPLARKWLKSHIFWAMMNGDRRAHV